MIPLIAAMLGALLAGAVQIALRVLDRRARRSSLRLALISEVCTLCAFIKVQRYVETYAFAAIAARQGSYAEMMPIDATQEYFTIYEGIGADIGLIPAHQVEAMVRFYTLAKIAIDTARPDGLYKNVTEQNLLFISGIARQLLELGNRIARFDARYTAVSLAQ